MLGEKSVIRPAAERRKRRATICRARINVKLVRLTVGAHNRPVIGVWPPVIFRKPSNPQVFRRHGCERRPLLTNVPKMTLNAGSYLTPSPSRYRFLVRESSYLTLPPVLVPAGLLAMRSGYLGMHR